MVGLQTLDLAIGVRVPASQPKKLRLTDLQADIPAPHNRDQAHQH